MRDFFNQKTAKKSKRRRKRGDSPSALATVAPHQNGDLGLLDYIECMHRVAVKARVRICKGLADLRSFTVPC